MAIGVSAAVQGYSGYRGSQNHKKVSFQMWIREIDDILRREQNRSKALRRVKGEVVRYFDLDWHRATDGVQGYRRVGQILRKIYSSGLGVDCTKLILDVVGEVLRSGNLDQAQFDSVLKKSCESGGLFSCCCGSAVVPEDYIQALRNGYLRSIQGVKMGGRRRVVLSGQDVPRVPLPVTLDSHKMSTATLPFQSEGSSLSFLGDRSGEGGDDGSSVDVDFVMARVGVIPVLSTVASEDSMGVRCNTPPELTPENSERGSSPPPSPSMNPTRLSI